MNCKDTIAIILSKLQFSVLLQHRLVSKFWNEAVMNNLLFIVKSKLGDFVIDEISKRDLMYIIKHDKDDLSEYSIIEFLNFYNWFSPLLNKLINIHIPYVRGENKSIPHIIKDFFKCFINEGFASKIRKCEDNLLYLDSAFENDKWIDDDFTLFKEFIMTDYIEYIITYYIPYSLSEGIYGIKLFEDIEIIINIIGVLICKYFNVDVDLSMRDMNYPHHISTYSSDKFYIFDAENITTIILEECNFSELIRIFSSQIEDLSILKKIQYMLRIFNHIDENNNLAYINIGKEINSWIMTLEE